MEVIQNTSRKNKKNMYLVEEVAIIVNIVYKLGRVGQLNNTNYEPSFC